MTQRERVNERMRPRQPPHQHSARPRSAAPYDSRQQLMSGPKAVTVTPDPAVALIALAGLAIYGVASGVVALANAATRIVRQRRALERLRQQTDVLNDVLSRLRVLGLSADAVEAALAESRALTIRVVSQTATEASVSALDQQAEALARHQGSSAKALEQRVAELQQRFQSLAQNSAQLRHQVAHLDAYVQAMLPADWPAPERAAVLQRMRTAQTDCQPPSAIEAELSVPGIARLTQAEQALATANGKLDRWQETLAAEVQSAHELRVRAAQLGESQCKEAVATAARHHEAKRRETLRREFAAASPRVSLADFLPTLAAPSAKECKVLHKLEDLMAKVGALQDTAGWADLMRRAVAVRAEIDPHRRLQFFESLCLEAGTRLKALRAAATWQAAVDALLQEAADYAGTAVDAVVAEFRELRRAGRVVPLEAWKLRLAETKKHELARLQREHQRRAILESLTALGYETSEGMGTALVEAGKLVIHKPGEADYAVELVANADLSLVQTAMVRYSDSDTLTEQQRLRDHEREAEWCGDHKRIRDQLEQRGYRTSFKMQMPAGTHPVRVVQRGAAPTARPTARGKTRRK